MLPGNVDPRRPEKVQRYKPPTANGQGEDLTPDYMNILGQRATSANAAPETTVDKHVVDGVAVVTKATEVAKLQQQPPLPQVLADPAEETSSTVTNKTSPPNNANVIPTSPQYGVAIIPNAVQCPATDITTETVTIVTDTVTDSTAKQPPDDAAAKDLHSTPSRNDRFKVVKIASLEPFKRGRWKCMDYVDEAPPPATQSSKSAQSASSIPVGAAAGGVYLQTQSLPQQQIQQMLLQSGYSNGTQFFQTVPAQMMPPTQYFYPAAAANVQGTQNVPQQLVNVVPGSIPTQFINASQPYFAAAGVVPNSAGFAIPPNYQNIQYPTNIMSNQNQSAFAPPTSQPAVQLPVNFQQSQSYSGQPSASQINGHAFPPQSEQQQLQLTSTSISTQAAASSKNAMNANVQQQPQPASSQSQAAQPTVQGQITLVPTGTQSRSVPIIQAQQYANYQIQPGSQQLPPQQQQQQQQNPQTIPSVQAFDHNQANNVYTNPQFDMNVNSLTVLENPEGLAETVNESGSGTEVAASENAANDDPSKTNPVVNAIDNKIEQAMDLVKSHLMYTVREEVEVLKEKIAELMEKIQQLETENNFLRSQIPKGATTAPSGGGPLAAASTAAPLTTTTTSTTTEAVAPAQQQQQQQQPQQQ